MMAQNFAEEALGPYTKSNGHADLMHEFRQDGLGLSLEELEQQQIELILRDSETFEEAAGRLGINSSTLWRR